MPGSHRTPFRVYANQNLGAAFDHTHRTGEWTQAKSTGHAAILPQVNLATGNITVSAVIKTQEQIGDCEFGFAYNAQSDTPWTNNTPFIVNTTSTTLILREQDGSLVNYNWDSGQNAYVAPAGGQSKPIIQKQTDGTYLQLDPKNNERKIFSDDGKLQSICDTRGRSMQYHYDTNGELQRIETTAGDYQFSKTNTTTTLNFTETGGTETQLAQWEFDDKKRLKTATIGDSNGYQIHYDYVGDTSQLAKISQDDQTSLHFSYNTDTPAKITTIQQGSNAPYQLNYTANQTQIIDPLGFTTTATLNAQSTIDTWSQAVGDTPSNAKTLETKCTYTNDDLTSITKPSGAVTSYTINQQGLTTKITAPNGQITKYDYDPQTGACLAKHELDSPGLIYSDFATARYLYETSTINGISTQLLRFTISPKGCVTEHRYNDSSQLASTRVYLSNTITLSNPTLAQVTSWANQQPLDQISLQTFCENNRGQCIQTQRFTTINPDGTGVDTDDASKTHSDDITIWGAVATRSEKLDSNNTALTHQTFDALHRLTSHENALNEKRTITYDDKHQQVTITEPNGRTEKSSWDDAGNITTRTTQIPGSDVTRITTHQYDSAGRPIAITGIDGQTTYQLFDNCDRLRYTITPAGRVQAHVYDDTNRYQQTTHYYNTVPVSTLSAPPTLDWITQNLVLDPANDINTFKSVDQSGRLQFEVDGRGAVTEYRYDLHNRKTATIVYAEPISTDELTALCTGQLRKTPTASDQANITFYDQDGHITATQNAVGYITTHQRNAAGFEIYQHQYATPTTLIFDNKLELPNVSADDFSQYFYLDARGQTRLTVDGVANAHFATANEFTATGKLKSQTCFANQTTKAPDFTTSPADLIPTNDTEDQHTLYERDLLQRVTKTHLPAQRLETTVYDTMGHAVLTSVGDDQSQLPAGATIQTQSDAKQYDDWGQLTAEAPPLVYEKIAAIQNDETLSDTEKQAQIDSIWQNQALRHRYDTQTGLHIATLDIADDDADFNDPATTLFYRDCDQRVVLTVGPEGQAKTTDWHSAFDKAMKTQRYANAIDAESLNTLTGGFISAAVSALLTIDDSDIIDQYTYDGAGGQTTHIDPDGYQTTTHFHMFGHWDQQQRPMHNTTPSLTVARSVNAAGQVLKETQTADGKTITTKKAYDNCHGTCTSETDGNGAVTTHTYEPRGVRQSTTNALGHTTSFEHDAFERETKQTLPLGNHISTSYDQTTRTETTTHTDQQGSTLRSTQKTKDAFGNVTASTDAKGATTTATFDADNQLASTTDALGNQTTFNRNRRGLLQNETTRLTTTQYTYTKSRKQKTRTEAAASLKLTTEHDFNAQGQRIKTFDPSGNLRLTSFNKRSLATKEHACLDAQAAASAKPGDPIDAVITEQTYNAQSKTDKITHYSPGKDKSFTQAVVHDGFGRAHQKIIDPDTLKLTHTTDFDDAGRVIAITDPKGQVTYQIRDAIGQLRFEINPKGGVTEHRYNANNQRVFTAQYTTPIDLSKISKGMLATDVAALITQTDLDRQTFYFYDDLGQERFRVNRDGAVIETRYNANGQEIASIQYYQPISGDFSTLTTNDIQTACTNSADASKDKATFRVLDALGQERFIFTAEGSVIEKRYDEVAHTVTHEIKYATPITNAADLSTQSIDDIKSKLVLSTSDRHSVWLHDALNRLQFHISATGAVTRYDYIGNTDNKDTITEFAATVNPTDDYNTIKTHALSLTTNPKIDKVEKRLYDQANREIQRIHAQGSDFEKTESWEYDGASRKTKHTTVTGHTWEYESDGANRLIKETSPQTTVYQTLINPNNATGITLGSTTTQVVKETDYDNNGNPERIISSSLFDAHQVLFEYDALDQKIEDSWFDLLIDDPTKTTSLTKPPVTKTDVSKRTIVNAFGAKMVEIDEANNPLFYCYNAQGHLIYRVNAKGYVTQYVRNAFGEAESFIFYANQLAIDLSKYQNTGLTTDTITANLTTDSNKDRSYHQTFNRMGKVVKAEKNPVVCYIPNKDPSLAPTISKQTPTQTTTFNAFGDEIAHATLIDQSTATWRTDLTWTDAQGKLIATVRADGKATVYTRDPRGRLLSEYEYATCIPVNQIPTTQTTFTQLQKLLATLSDHTKDHETLTPRDLLGRKTAQQITHEIVQTVSGQSFSDQPAKTLTTTYSYTSDDQIKTITYPNDSVEIRYYDERRFLIAKALPARSQHNPDGSTTLIRPIEYYRYDAHGKRVEIFKPDSGCAVTLDPTSNDIPLPLKTDDQKDYDERFFYDARHRILAHQNADGHLKQKTYTATGKVARHYHATSNPDSTDKTKNVTHIDEHQHAYDELDRLTSTRVLRDNTAQAKTVFSHDAFAVTTEGPGDGTTPIQHKTDQAGREWFRVNDKGAVEIVGYDVAGHETVVITALDIDLSQTTINDLPTLMAKREVVTNKKLNYQFQETVRDNVSRPIQLVEPGYLEPNQTDAKIIRPVHQIAWNAFDKKSQTTTPSGDKTTFDYNKRDKLTQQTNPEIAVMDEHGTASTVAPKTVVAYNDNDAKIGERDANNHTETWTKDEANQEVARFAADGVPYFLNTLNALGYAFKVTSATGNTWLKTTTRKGKVTAVTYPSGDQWRYDLNENDFAIRIIPPKGSARGTTCYAQGIFGDVIAEYLPMGESHLYTTDRNHQTLMHTAVNIDGTTAYRVIYERDYFGKLTKKTDGSGSVYQNDYYFTGDIKREYGVRVTGHGEMPIFDSTTGNFTQQTVAMPLQDLNYEYLTSLRLYQIIDKNTVKPQTLVKLFDINRNPVYIKETNGAGKVLRETTMTFNAMRWPVTQRDVNFSLDYYYDPVGNRRRMNGTYRPCGLAPVNHDAWWTYDIADRVLIDNGELQNNEIVSPGFVGSSFTYKNGLRDSQSVCIDNIESVSTNFVIFGPIHKIQYSDNDFFNCIEAEIDAMSRSSTTITLKYFQDGLLNSIQQASEKKQLMYLYNLNGLSIQTTFDCESPGSNPSSTKQTTKQLSFNVDGIPINTTSTLSAGTTTNDSYTNTFMLFDSTVIASIQATRTNQNGTSKITSNRYYDANGQLTMATNVNDSLNCYDRNPSTAFLVSGLSRRILKEIFVPQYPTQGNPPTENQFFYDNNGNLIVRYGLHFGYTINQIKFLACPIKTKVISALENFSGITTIQRGETWEDVANVLFQDTQYTPIARRFSSGSLTPGQYVNAQQVLTSYNRANDFSSYQQFLASIYNALQPALQTPQPPAPHESFWDEVIGIVVSIVVMIVVPGIGTSLLGVMGPLLEGLVYGVAGALADAASQSIAIAFGDQHGFSLREMLENAMSSGLTAGISNKLHIDEMLNNTQYSKAFISYVTVGTTVQLLQMSIGLRQKFDIKQIIEQATAAIATAKINNSKAMKHAPSVVAHAVDELANSAIGAAVGQNPDLTALAANTLGDEAADGADVLAEHVRSHLAAHVDENEDTHSEPPTPPTSYRESARSTHVDDVFNMGDRQKDAYQQFMDDSLKAQEDEIARSSLSAAEALWDTHSEAHASFTTKLWHETEGAGEFAKDFARNIENLGESLGHHPLDTSLTMLHNTAGFVSDQIDELEYVTSFGHFGNPAAIARNEVRGEALINYFSALAHSHFGSRGQGYLLAEGLSWVVPNGVAGKVVDVGADAARLAARSTVTVASRVGLGSVGFGRIVARLDGDLSDITKNWARFWKLDKENSEIQTLNHSVLHFTQSSVNNVDIITENMRCFGWQGAPIDVVRMSDGKLVTIDNSRVLAASRANIPVKAIIHDANEPLSTEFSERFMTKQGGFPKTWEEAALNRINKQNYLYRSTYPNGSSITGAKQ